MPDAGSAAATFADSSANSSSKVFTAGRPGARRSGEAEKPVARCGVRSPRRVSAVASAAMVASQPLSSAEPGSPARSRACSSVSQVRTPLPTGLPASRATRVSPAVTASQTYSKCGVPPRMTTPSATTASCRSASAWATTGSSTAPGARTTVGSATPLARAASTARASSWSVISACQVVATMPSVSPAASTASTTGAPLPLMKRCSSTCRGTPAGTSSGPDSVSGSMMSSRWPIRSRLVRR